MWANTVHEREVDPLPISSYGEAGFSNPEPEGLDVIALRLWQIGSCFGTLGDECWLCKGGAQRCLAICQ